MTSMFDVIFASRPGLRYGEHPTIWPSLMREVRWLMAAIVVQHSNIVSWAGTGTLWKWSYTHSESKPSSSASWAISTALAHLACGSSIETNSIFQPWGTKTPNVRSWDAMAACSQACDDAAQLTAGGEATACPGRRWR